jgi:uncharacterized protein YcfL
MKYRVCALALSVLVAVGCSEVQKRLVLSGDCRVLDKETGLAIGLPSVPASAASVTVSLNLDGGAHD